MPEPTGVLSIVIKTTSAANAGEKIKVVNLTNGGTIYGELNAKGEFEANALDSFSNWTKGDTIVAEIHGRLQGYATDIMGAKGIKLTMNDAADTSSQGVDL